MSITLDEVKHVAQLARLELDDGELFAFQGELNALLGHFQDIQEVEVGGHEPKPHAVELLNVWAEDVPGECLPRDAVLSNAPMSKAGVFIVPTIIQE